MRSPKCAGFALDGYEVVTGTENVVAPAGESVPVGCNGLVVVGGIPIDHLRRQDREPRGDGGHANVGRGQGQPGKGGARAKGVLIANATRKGRRSRSRPRTGRQGPRKAGRQRWQRSQLYHAGGGSASPRSRSGCSVDCVTLPLQKPGRSFSFCRIAALCVTMGLHDRSLHPRFRTARHENRPGGEAGTACRG